MKKSLFTKIGAIALGLGLLVTGGVSLAHTNVSEAKAAAITKSALTGLSDIVDGSSYLLGASLASGSTEYYPVVSEKAISAGGISAASIASVDSDTVLLTLNVVDASKNTYYIQVGSYYLYANGANNGLALGTTKDVWTVSYVANKGFTFKEGTNSRYLTRYQSSNFRSYESLFDFGDSQNSYFSIYSVAQAADVAPTSVSLSTVTSTMSVGETQQVTATMLPATTTEKVVWSVSDSSVATINETTTSGGVSIVTLTAVGNGTVTLTATAETTTSITATSSNITCSGAVTAITPVVLTTTRLNITGNSYVSGDALVDDAVFGYADILCTSQDYTDSKSGVTTYEKGAIQFKKSSGYIWNKTKFAAGIKKVTVVAVATSTNLVVYGGNVLKPASTNTVATKTNVQINGTASFMFEYTFETACNYITIFADSNTCYINEITLEFDGGVETVSTLANFINGIISNRSEEIGLCTGSAGNYAIAKTRLLAATASVIAEFQTSSDGNVVSARTRYEIWCANVGDAEPYGSTIVSSNKINSILTKNSPVLIVIVSITGLALLSSLAFFMLRKKKAQ